MLQGSEHFSPTEKRERENRRRPKTGVRVATKVERNVWGELECHVIDMRSEARAEQVVGMGCSAVVRRGTRAACEAMRNASVFNPDHRG